jgi:hypothetical protein
VGGSGDGSNGGSAQGAGGNESDGGIEEGRQAGAGAGGSGVQQASSFSRPAIPPLPLHRLNSSGSTSNVQQAAGADPLASFLVPSTDSHRRADFGSPCSYDASYAAAAAAGGVYSEAGTPGVWGGGGVGGVGEWVQMRVWVGVFVCVYVCVCACVYVSVRLDTADYV